MVVLYIKWLKRGDLEIKQLTANAHRNEELNLNLNDEGPFVQFS